MKALMRACIVLLLALSSAGCAIQAGVSIGPVFHAHAARPAYGSSYPAQVMMAPQQQPIMLPQVMQQLYGSPSAVINPPLSTLTVPSAPRLYYPPPAPCGPPLPMGSVCWQEQSPVISHPPIAY